LMQRLKSYPQSKMPSTRYYGDFLPFHRSLFSVENDNIGYDDDDASELQLL